MVSSDLGFTPWKPPQDSGQGYGSTDTPDFFEDQDENSSGLPQETTAKEAEGALEKLMQSDSWTIGGKKASSERYPTIYLPNWPILQIKVPKAEHVH